MTQKFLIVLCSIREVSSIIPSSNSKKVKPQPSPDQPQQPEENVTKYVQDTSLSSALRQVVSANTTIEGLNSQLVERLEHYQ